MFKFLRERKKDNKGFTLVELVIVIAILAILFGLLAPQYTKYVEKSRKAADASNMDELVKVIKVYAGDTDSELPAGKYVITISNTGTSTLTGDDVTAVANIKAEFTAASPKWESLKTKSKKWGDKGATSAITATIEVKADGGTSVTYSPKAFADFVGGEETKTTGGTGASAGTQETGK